jgi:Arc/MetJ-type ribon-helix-helix transcriptional regulator
MTDIVHARLDAHTRQIMRRLKRRYGWTDSEVVRQGIRALSETELTSQERCKQVVGLGKFESGVSDLGSNKARLRQFGR